MEHHHEHHSLEHGKFHDGADPHLGFSLDQEMQEQIRQASQDIRDEGRNATGHDKKTSPKHESATGSPKHEVKPSGDEQHGKEEHESKSSPKPDKSPPKAETPSQEPKKTEESPKHQAADIKEDKPAKDQGSPAKSPESKGESPVVEKREEHTPPKPSPEQKEKPREPEPVKTDKTPEKPKEEERSQPEKKASPQEEEGKLYGFLRSEDLTEESEKKGESLYPKIPPEQVEQEKPKTRQSPQQKRETGPASYSSAFNPRAWFDAGHLDPKVADLIYWRDAKQSGIVLFSVLAILVSLSSLSLISVVAYVSLIALSATTCFRIYKNVLQAIHKTEAGHPFKEYLEMDLTLPQEKVQEASVSFATQLNNLVNQLRHVFLVEDLFDSIKFGVLLWALTYVGAWFNGLTLVILSVVGVFTLPKVYETYQEPIDQQLGMVKGHLDNITAKIQAVLPIGKKEKSQ